MDKSPEAFRTISEVADALDVPPHVLRFWETRFASGKAGEAGRRPPLLSPEDVRLLRGIRGLLYDDGMTIKGVQKILREKGIRHVIGLGTVAEPETVAVDAAVVDPIDAGPAARPAARRVAAAKPQGGRPQADLFGEATTKEAPRTTEALSPGGKSLRALVAELEALRAVIVADPKR